MEHKTYIVITSIFPPTEAIQKFAKVNDCQLVVVGDKKTPRNWHWPNVVFLPVDDCSIIHTTTLQEVLPYNHYCRKMLGYLYALQEGAEVIIDTDDDNIPHPEWGFPEFTGEYKFFQGEKGFVNIYNYFTEQYIWPRGLPLNVVSKRNDFSSAKPEKVNVGIWQGLADEDPDVDAIYRLVIDKPCNFTKQAPIVMDKGTVCPFNTQNTCIRKELFPLLYLPVNVSFRFTDILRGLVAQPIMWLHGFHLGFISATVVQKRNPHDYFKDFLMELPMYQYCEDIIESVDKSISLNRSLSDNLYEAYHGLVNLNIVPAEEMPVLQAWLRDLVGVGTGKRLHNNMQP